MTVWERPLGGDWEFHIPKMAWLTQATPTGYSMQLMSWLASSEVMGVDVGEGHVAEVHGGGRIVPSETPTADTMHRV